MKELQERIDDAIFFLETEYNTYPSGNAWRKALKKILEGNKIKKLNSILRINDLVIKTQKDGKTIEDHSNEDAIYKMYQGEEMLKILDEICTKYFNMTVVDLVKDMELTQEQELKFGGDLMEALIGKESPKKSQ